jgi:hypothetical protein
MRRFKLCAIVKIYGQSKQVTKGSSLFAMHQSGRRSRWEVCIVCTTAVLSNSRFSEVIFDHRIEGLP